MDSEAQRRAAALFKKEQQLREGQQAMDDYQTELHAMREKTARLRALRLARDAANQKTAKPTRRPLTVGSARQSKDRRSQAC
jgi:hypothetical protein